jgi:glutaredoxin
MNCPAVILYTRQGCHLCDDAKEALRSCGLSPQEIDIDEHPDLRARYDECVPVVVMDGVERFRGHVDKVLLRRLLAGSRNGV